MGILLPMISCSCFKNIFLDRLRAGILSVLFFPVLSAWHYKYSTKRMSIQMGTHMVPMDTKVKIQEGERINVSGELYK